MGAVEKVCFTVGVLSGQEIESDVLMAILNLTNTVPQREVTIRKLGHNTLIEALLENKIDVAITLVPDGESLVRDLEYMDIKRVKMYLLASEKDPIWKAEVDLKDLDGRILIIQGEDHPGYTAFMASLRKAGCEVRIETAPSPETAVRWLEMGMGVAVTNEGAVMYSEQMQKRITAVPIPGADELAVVLVKNRGNSSREMSIFIDHILKTLLQS